MPIGKTRNGYAPELEPLPGEAELERLSGLMDVVKPFLVADVATIGVGATAAFVWSRIGRGREAILVAFGFDWEGQDLTLAPVTLESVTLAPNQGSVADAGAGNLILGPMRAQVGALTTPFVMPFYVRLEADKEVALVCRNASGVEGDAQGMLYGIHWDKTQSRNVRRALWGLRPIDIWRGGLFTNGGGVGR